MTSDKNIAFSELATKLMNEVHETALHQKPFIKSLQKIVELLKSLKLESHVNHQGKDIKINEIEDEDIATIRMRIATSLLNLDRVIIVSSSLTSEKNSTQSFSLLSSSSTENEVNLILDQCLDLCGAKNMVLCANQCLVQVASSGAIEKIDPVPPYSVLLAIRTMKRIFVPLSLSTNIDYLFQHSNNAESRSEKFRLIYQLTNEFTDPKRNIDNRDKENDMESQNGHIMDELARIIVILPIRIASALHLSKLASSLPLWATRTHYFQRVLHCVTAAFFYASKRNISYLGLDVDESDQILNMEQLLQSIIHLIIRHGGANDVSYALFQFFINVTPQANDANATNENSQEYSDLKNKYECFICKTITSLVSPRESISLLRSFIFCISAHCNSKDGMHISSFDSSENNNIVLTKLRSPMQNNSREKFKKMVPFLKIFCLKICQSNLSIREKLVRYLLLSASPSDCADVTVSWSIALLLYYAMQTNSSHQIEIAHTNAKNEQAYVFSQSKYLNHLEEIMAVWSQATFVHHTDLSVQNHVTNFILKTLSLISNDNGIASSFSTSVIPILVQGVTARLESSIVEVRIHGMKVAEAFAPLTEQTLSFEELRKFEDTRETQNLDKNNEGMEKNDFFKEMSLGKTDRKGSITKKKTHKEKKKNLKEAIIESNLIDFDPDKEYFSDCDSNSRSDSTNSSRYDISGNQISENDDQSSLWDSLSEDDDDEDYVVPFDLKDDEQDLYPISQPHYLSQCLKLLRSPESDKETYDKHLVALRSLPNILETCPMDTPDLAVVLANEILHLENKFDMPNFTKMRMDCLIKLAVLEPILVCEHLIKEKVFEVGMSLSTRYEVLEVLEIMSEKLSGSESLRIKREIQKKR